ncbi:MAG: DUF4236 domain-containing protein [Bradyrhizobium sp.]
MLFRFQKRISILPGVRLNFSRSGVSTTIGVRGASVTLGGRGGPTANLSIPGSGLSIRTPLQQRSEHIPRSNPGGLDCDAPTPGIPSSRPPAPTFEMNPIQSESVQSLTTQGLTRLKELILQSQENRDAAEKTLAETKAYREEADRVLTDAQRQHTLVEQRILRIKSSWFHAFRKSRIAQMMTQLEEANLRRINASKHLRNAHELMELAEQGVAQLYLDLEFNLSGPAHGAWTRLTETFELLSRSQRIWDITASRDKRAGAERSVATKIIDRKTTHLSIAELPIIQSQYKALRWHNANGGDLFIFPGFIIVFQTKEQFAMLELSEVQLEFNATIFQEHETCPSDAKQVGLTWTYTNRDGSPDRRYANNPQIPMLLYGEIHWTSKTGMSEAFSFSNAEAAAIFIDALTDFRRVIAP